MCVRVYAGDQEKLPEEWVGEYRGQRGRLWGTNVQHLLCLSPLVYEAERKKIELLAEALVI